MNTKIFITGGSGTIGSKLVESLYRENNVSYTFVNHPYFAEGCTSFKLDITERKSTIDLITQIKPEITIHTSALTDVDLCETNRKLADEINVEGTRNIVDACKKVNSKIIYISTSNVFNGKKNIFLEDDSTCPINYYGSTKAIGERIVISSQLAFLILRTDQPYTWIKKWQKKNFIIWLLEKIEANEVVEVFKDWYNNPTFLDNFVEATSELMKKGKEGIYHIIGSDFINRYDWALKIVDILGEPRSLIKSIESSQSELPAKRANANLSNIKAQKETGVNLIGVQEGLRLMFKGSNYSRND